MMSYKVFWMIPIWDEKMTTNEEASYKKETSNKKDMLRAMMSCFNWNILLSIVFYFLSFIYLFIFANISNYKCIIQWPGKKMTKKKV